MLQILFAFLAVALLGGLLGVGLAIASNILTVKKDKRIEEVSDILPGLNCGACGYVGCSSYAEAMVKEDEELTLCTPGGGDTAKALGEYFGKKVELSDEKRVTQVHCRGNRETSAYSFEYSGIEDCNALYALYKGDKTCPYGCLGKGSCIKVCPVDAIDYDREGLVWVDKDKCIACGKCIDICPTGVMKWIPYDADYIVACNSTDKGGQVKKYCSVGCIGCKICEKQSPEGGFQVEDFLARIDYTKSGDRTKAAEKCPTKCIISVPPREQVKEELAAKKESDNDILSSEGEGRVKTTASDE